MQVLVTGAGGFVGGHLAERLLALPDLTLHASVFRPPGENPRLDNRPVRQYQVDLRDAAAVRHLIDTVRPDWVFHLAALANVPQSFKNPWHTLENNIVAQVHLLEAIRAVDINPRILVVGSAEVYGAAGGTRDPLDESWPFEPTNPYSVSKVTQDMLGLQYHLAHGMDIIRARPFNHMGPGQGRGFVSVDFASQIAAIEAREREPVLFVGNLTAERDFTDVRDVVRSYVLMMQHGRSGDVFNVCSERGYSIQYLLDTLLGFSTAVIEVRQDPARMRPSDVPRRVGDAARLRECTGWEPTISFEESLLDILNDWRVRMGIQPGASRTAGE